MNFSMRLSISGCRQPVAIFTAQFPMKLGLLTEQYHIGALPPNEP
jgi:hypothetical protein